MPGGRESKSRYICIMYSRLLVTSTYLCHSRIMILLFCVCVHFSSKRFLSPSLKQYLVTIGKHLIFRKWDSAVQRIQIFWSNLPANSKILLDIVKATLTVKNPHNGQRIKAVSTTQNKCACAGKRSNVWSEPNFMSRWRFLNLFFWSWCLELHWLLSNTLWKWYNKFL